MAQNQTCNLSVTGRPSSPLRHVFKVPPMMMMQILEKKRGYILLRYRYVRGDASLAGQLACMGSPLGAPRGLPGPRRAVLVQHCVEGTQLAKSEQCQPEV
jgi:hypothetical protein